MEKKSPAINKPHFADWISKLDFKDYKRVKNAILDECAVTYPVFYNWMRGISKIPRGYWKLIDVVVINFELSRENYEFQGLIYSPVSKDRAA